MIQKNSGVFLIFFIMTSCMRITNYGVSSDIAKQETLISEIQGKIITNGVISFLRYENDTLRMIRYSCQMQEKTKTAHCQKLESKVWDIPHASPNSFSGFYTSTLFKAHVEKKPVLKKYYNCFSENFLDLTNDEKIKLLDEIASKCEK